MILLLFLYVNMFSQNRITFEKSERKSLNNFPESVSELKKIIENNIYSITLNINLDSLVITDINLNNYDINIYRLSIKNLKCEGIIDFYIEDEKLYLLADNGSRVLAFNKYSVCQLDVNVKNPHSNIFKYTAIHAYKGEIYLLYTIDMSTKTDDIRNLFIDKLNNNNKQIDNIFANYVNANFFLISSYKSWTFYKNTFFYCDIISGSISYIILEYPSKVNVIENNIYDKDSINSKRVFLWEKNYHPYKTQTLIDSIRSYYANQISTTWITVHDSIVSVLDKLPGDTCNALFRSYNLKTGRKDNYLITNANKKCITKPYLNLMYVNETKVIQFFNFMEPGKGQSLKYHEFIRQID